MSPVNHPEEIVVGTRHHGAAERQDRHRHQGWCRRQRGRVKERQTDITVTRMDGRPSPVLPIPAAFKLVKNAVILIEGAQLIPEIFMHLLNRGTSNVLISNCRTRPQITSICVKPCPPVEVQ